MDRDLPSLNALKAFEAVARHLSIGKAAEELHVTHGAVSRQIKLLENTLTMTLTEKEGRGIKLTNDGVLLRDVCQDAFLRLRQGIHRITSDRTQQPFVLGCPGSLLARWFIPRLEQLSRDLPALQLQLSAAEGDLDPRGGGRDATLCFAEPPWPDDMQVHALAVERIGPVVSPRFPRNHSLLNAPPRALLDEPLLHTVSRPQAWPTWAAMQGLAIDQLRYGQKFEHLYYLLEAAVAGLGVAIAPAVLVADDLASNRLAAPWGFIETQAKLSLWAPKHVQDGRARQLADWLVTQLSA